MVDDAVPQTLSAERRALQTRRLRQDPEAVALLMGDPIAIIGMGCRFPGGVGDPEEFWQALVEGRSAISPAPADRWFGDDRPPGGYIDTVSGVDLGYFGLSEREAEGIDPQQRLLLEVAMEALEDAGLSRTMLAGSRTGVFVGACVSDYARRALAPGRAPDPYAISGIADAMLANRLSYLLDLAGPSLAVDTACSSSLVALHLACQSLRTADCDQAVVGGVNAILSADIGRSLASSGMLAPDGMCKTFDARADGFVRGEGAGVIVLRRLVDAMGAGDRIHAVVRGSAVNQDGRSNGLTAPNPLAQERVIRAALANAGVQPAAVGYVEAHGTGTALGDPIEVEALRAVYGGAGRSATLRVGAVKANIGHLEGASGVAGIIKTVLCLKHGRIPRQIHYLSPNPNFGRDVGLHIPVRTEPWTAEAAGQRRYAGVSAFGFGGTNVHVVLEETPPALLAHPARGGADPHPVLLTITAADRSALARRAGQAAEMLAAGVDPVALQATLALRSSHFSHRLAATGHGADLIAALRAAADGGTGPDVVIGQSQGSGAGPVFVFSGQAGQWPGMGLGLLAFPAFRTAFEACDAALGESAGWSALDVLEGRDPKRTVDCTEVAQPVIVALEIALAALLRSLGVMPAAVIGHSVGEIAAAVVAGAFTPAEGMAIAARRGALMADLAGQGTMVAVEAAPEVVRAALDGLEADIAALNGPNATVVSGTPEAVAAVIARLARPHRRLDGTCAFHGRQTVRAAESLSRALGGLRSRPPAIVMISTLTGRPVETLDADYWARQMRQPVAFAPAAAQLMESGHSGFIEVGPHPALLSSLRQIWEARGGAAADLALTPTLRRSTDDRLSLLRTVGSLFVHGFAPDWSALGIGRDRLTPLPAYPWQRTPCWLSAPGPGADGPDVAGEPDEPDEPGDDALYAVDFATLPSRSGTPAAPRGSWRVIGSGALADALTASLSGSDGEPRRIVVMATIPAGAAAAVAAVAECIAAVTASAGGPAWLVTGDPTVDPAAAALWGLAQSVGWELPGQIAGVIGLAAGDPAVQAAGIMAELGVADADQHRDAAPGGRVLLDGSERRGPALRRIAPAGAGRRPIDPAGAYLVTGGLGGLGLATACWLADRGARHLVLAGRRPPSAEVSATLEVLRRRGVAVEVAASDVADPDAVERLVAGFGAIRPPLRGLIHAAGVLRDSLLPGQDRAAVGEIFAAKAGGAETIVRLAGALMPDFIVFMSSMAGVFGAPGQAGYAAANAYLDALARRCRARGIAATSLVWGPWRDIGMAHDLGPEAARRRRARGIGALTTPDALACLEQALGEPHPVLAALRIDWPQFRQAMPVGAGPRVTLAGYGGDMPDAIRPSPAMPVPPAAPQPRPPAARLDLSALPPLARQGRLRQLIGETLAAIMGGRRPDPDRGFFDQGMDSLIAVEFSARLENLLGCPVGATAMFEHATVVKLTDYLLKVIVLETTRREADAPASLRPSDTVSELLAALEGTGAQAIDARHTR